jgi:hypothetical protein
MSQSKIYAKLAYLAQHKISSLKKWGNSKISKKANQELSFPQKVVK